MELSHEIRRIRSFPPALPIALELLVEQAQYADRDSFLSDVLPIIGDAVSAGRVELVEAQQGRWQQIASAGAAEQGVLPDALLGDVLDAEEIRSQSPWLAARCKLGPPRAKS